MTLYNQETELLFLDAVLSQAHTALSMTWAKAEQNILRKIMELQSICDERQALIQRLHEACEKLRASPEPGPGR